MATSAEEAVATDSLGRRTGPRRPHSLEEKLQIVKETHAVGASVSTVARRHNVNPNQVFAWRQLYRQGLLKPGASTGSNPLLPVKVSTPTVLPTELRPTLEGAIVALAQRLPGARASCGTMGTCRQ